MHILVITRAQKHAGKLVIESTTNITTLDLKIIPDMNRWMASLYFPFFYSSFNNDLLLCYHLTTIGNIVTKFKDNTRFDTP